MSKSNEHVPAIYMLTNTVNNKIYIGETSNFAKRMSRYRCTERRYKRRDRTKTWNDTSPISQAILEYGFDSFTIEIIVSIQVDPNIADIKYRRMVESYFIVNMNAIDPEVGYNVLETNYSITYNKTKGFKHTTETKLIKSTTIFAYDTEGDYTCIYLGHKSAAQLLGISDRSIIASASNNGKSIKGKYIFKINIDKRIKNVTNIVTKKCEKLKKDRTGYTKKSIKNYLHALKRVNDYCEITGFATVDYDKVVTPILKKYNIDL